MSKAEYLRPIAVIGSSRRLLPRHLAGVAVPRPSEPPLEAVEGLGATVGEIVADLQQDTAGELQGHLLAPGIHCGF